MTKHFYKILPFALILPFLLMVSLNGKMEESKTVTQEIHELANDWKPNWEDPHQLKFYIYDGPEGPAIGESNVRRIYGVSYFETASQAGEAMLYLGDKLRVME